MIDEARLDALVSGLYGAATGGIGWDEALTPMQQAFGARAAVVQSVDLASGHIVQLAHGGPPMHEAFFDYLRHWHALDPRRTHLVAHAGSVVGRWWHCHEHFDEAFAGRDRFYRHFLPANNTRYLATHMHMPTPGMLTAFALELPAERGPLDAGERVAAGRLSQHFQEAMRQHTRLRRLAAEALAGHRLLDAFTHPMWLLDTDRFVFHANTAALTESTAVTDHGRWRWRDDTVDRRIGEALHGLPAQDHGTRRRVDLRRHRNDPPRWLLLQALRPGRVLGAFGEQALALLTLLDPARMAGLDAFALAEAFGLTPAQARVAVLLADGRSGPEMAASLACSLATVRSHLRAVLTRIGARRSADAVRLLRQGEALWAQAGAAASHPA